MRTTGVTCDDCGNPIDINNDAFCTVRIGWNNPADLSGPQFMDFHKDHAPEWVGTPPDPSTIPPPIPIPE